MSKKKLIFLIVLPIAVFLLSLFLGRYPITPDTVVKVLFCNILPIERAWPAAAETVIFQIRLPRIIIAMLVGGALSISGAAYQGMFHNPLVSPDILGVSSAAGFGAALGILMSGSSEAIQAMAFVFGMIGVLLTYIISRVYKTTPTLMLVLSGVVVAAFFSALISAVLYIADPIEKLPGITFWLMGGLHTVSTKNVIPTLIPITVGTIALLSIRWRINILTMGDEQARSLGVRTELLKAYIIVCATLLTATAVCVSGLIGWVGLVIPHIGRMIVGPDHRVLLPTSLVLGSSYLLLIDNIARTVISAEIPLGILTAIIGAPFFAYLLRKTKGGWK